MIEEIKPVVPRAALSHPPHEASPGTPGLLRGKRPPDGAVRPLGESLDEEPSHTLAVVASVRSAMTP